MKSTLLFVRIGFKKSMVLSLFLLLTFACLAQHVVTGTVRDSTGGILTSVTVSVKEQPGKGTSTDLNGKFVMDVSQNSTLVFSLVGFEPVEEELRGRAELNIVLMSLSTTMDEVVVVGFGRQKKITTVGAQATIRPEELKLPVRNLNTMLTGRISGLIGVQRSGEPGNDNADIFIRGIATLDANLSRPLVLVDGVERPMNDIDPEDIESFTMLKDASATAVYGVRGANGVIIINTKKGVPGKPKIKVRYMQGLTTFTKLPDLADGITYMQMSNEASLGRGGNPNYTQDRINRTISGEDPYLYPNVDWYDAVFDKWAGNNNVNLNISGGSQLVTYYLSAGYFGEEGILKSDALAQYNSKLRFDRYNFTSNLTLNASRTTKIDLGVQGNMTSRNLPGSVASSTLFDYVMAIPPVFHAVKYPDRLAGSTSTVVLNPYNSLTQSGYRSQWNNRLYSNLRLTQEILFLPGLSVTGLFSFDATNAHNNNRTKNPDRWFATGRDEAGELMYDRTFTGSQYLGFSSSSTGSRQFYSEAAINYQSQFGDHGVGGLILYNQRDFMTTGGDLITSLPFRARGVASRLNYSYKETYMAEFNFGYNGSENFDPEKRYGFFPSVGLGWVVSSEEFFGPMTSWIQFLKLRATHGLVGNSEIGGRRFAFIGTVANSTGYSFGRGQANDAYVGIDLDEYPVDVTWETAEKTNIGVEIHTLSNRLNLQLDFFREQREGIFLRRTSLPQFLGIQKEPYGNLGVVLNQGADATVTYNQRVGNVNLNLQGNFTYAKNKVLRNDDPSRPYPWLSAIGNKVTQHYGYVAEGLFRDSTEILNSPVQTGDVRPGDLKFSDLNDDGIINQNDMKRIGYGQHPELIYGFGLTGSYKGISIGAFFQGAGRVDIVMNREGFIPFSAGSERGNLFSNIDERWTPENPNPNAFYPRLSFGALNDNYRTNTWFVKDVSYMRLKTLQIAYELPQNWFAKIGVQNARLSFIGYNVLTFSDFKFWDVELGTGNGSTYPNMSTYSLAIDINF